MRRTRSQPIAKRCGSQRRGAWATGGHASSQRSSSPQEPHRHRAASPADPAAHHVTLSGSPGMPDFESANDTIYVPI
jgi:hypothetical protein